MSTYVREKVLRVPFDKYKEHFRLEITDPDDMQWSIEHAYPKLWGYGDIGKFQFAPTETLYVDYVLDYEYDCDGEYGKVRDLYDQEKRKYFNTFYEIFNDIDMDDVKLVEFCWYNGCDAPDYYDITQDKFYDPV